MPRLVAILLLALLVLPWATAASATGQGSDAGLPACCRRNGQHHCAMTLAERAQAAPEGARWKAPADRCPYCPACSAGLQGDRSTTPPTVSALAAFSLDCNGCRAAACTWRTARERARHKRGPPQPTLLAGR